MSEFTEGECLPRSQANFIACEVAVSVVMRQREATVWSPGLVPSAWLVLRCLPSVA